ncbi:MAG: GNAT family N-acetyltransferase [Coriobacteriales bacterium]|jgi:ribosomal-protein-alanine N-acetyltransferase|nr:GNAT family N-acetyltransferase [Coriobacteriales bacterium]
MNRKGTVTLETKRLLLRQFALEDAAAVFRNYACDPEVTKYLIWPPHKSVRMSEAWCALNVNSYTDATYYSWTIVLKELGEPIGGISVVEQDARAQVARIGYCIGRAWWHQGYTTEALKTVVAFLFDEVGFNRIESDHDPRNPNSGKVMEGAGLTYEGTHRQADWSNQGICDSMVYALLKEDYHSSGNSLEHGVRVQDT